MVTVNRIRLTGLLPRSPRIARASLLVVAFAFASPPAADAPLPHTATTVAKALSGTRTDLRAAVAAWAPKASPAPEEVLLAARYERRLSRRLARDTRRADAVLPMLAPDLRATTRDLLAAHRELFRLTPPLPAHAEIRVGTLGGEACS